MSRIADEPLQLVAGRRSGSSHDESVCTTAAEIADELGRLGTFAFHVSVRGRTVFEFGPTNVRVRCASMRKSFMSALVGIAVERGLFELDTTLDELGIDDREGLSAAERRATVRHLLMGRSGIYHRAASQGHEFASFPARHRDAPGERWTYNNWDFNVLGTILRARCGLNAFDAFDRWIAQPIGMEDFDPATCADRFDAVSMHAAYKFRMSARDQAKFGLLYLRGGRWCGEQIVPAAWVTASTHAWTPASETAYPFGGFGYMWWVGPTADFGTRPHFSAHGGTAQAIIVIPQDEIVVVHANRDNPDDNGTSNSPAWRDAAPVIHKAIEFAEEIAAP